MPNRMTSYERAMALAAVCGSKIALGPALLAASRRRPSAGAWVAAALGEMLLDKLKVFPPRYRPMLLVPHTVAGGWVAYESLKEDGVNDPTAAVTGAVLAAGVASVAPLVRIALSKGLGIPDPLLGVAEDYVFLRLGTEAMDLSMDQLPELAQEAAGEIRERLRPAMQSLGVGA